LAAALVAAVAAKLDPAVNTPATTPIVFIGSDTIAVP